MFYVSLQAGVTLFATSAILKSVASPADWQQSPKLRGVIYKQRQISAGERERSTAVLCNAAVKSKSAVWALPDAPCGGDGNRSCG